MKCKKCNSKMRMLNSEQSSCFVEGVELSNSKVVVRRYDCHKCKERTVIMDHKSNELL